MYYCSSWFNYCNWNRQASSKPDAVNAACIDTNNIFLDTGKRTVMVKMDDQNKATRIEKLMLLHERELPAVDNSLFFVGSMPYTSFKTKLNLLLRSAFLAETLTLFYISLGLFAFVMINVF